MHRFSIECMTQKMATLIGNSIGDLLEIDCDRGSNWVDPCMWIKVRLDLT